MRSTLISAFLAVAILAHPLIGKPRMEMWTDYDGKTFKGEPTGIYGPFAFFKTSRTSTRGVRLRAMSAKDCVRFYEGLQEYPAHADDWAQATSVLSKEVFDQAHHLRDKDIAKVDLTGRPEPDFYIMIYASHGRQESWDAFPVLKPAYERLMKAYPDRFEGVFIGVKHSYRDHANMMNEVGMPWLTNDVESQLRECPIAMGFRPELTPSIVILNRHGVPIYASAQPTPQSIEKSLVDFEGLLVQMKPGRTSNAPDLKNYYSAVQPVAYKTGKCAPMLLASPLDPDGLRQAGIKRVDANFTIGPDHAVRDVQVFDNGGILPQNVVDQLAQALKNAVFVAGVENGKFVESVYEMHLVLDQ